jgi:hypothetical protein
MANVNDLCIAVLGALEAGLAGVDYVSSTSYMPAIQTHTVSLVGVAQGQADDGMFYSEGWLHGVHRLRFEFWVKLVQGKENVYTAMATCLRQWAVVLHCNRKSKNVQLRQVDSLTLW